MLSRWVARFAPPAAALLLYGQLASSLAQSADTSTSIDFAKVREQFQESVVHIHAIRTRKDGAGAREPSYGTGFVISSDGDVLTANHVVLKEDNDTMVEVTGASSPRDGNRHKLEIIRRDEEADLALLRFPDLRRKWTPVPFGFAASVPVEAPLYTMGFAGNRELASARGNLTSRFGPKGTWQTSLPINRGNSGGPVFDTTGKVVAIAAAGHEELQLVTYAIPESHARGLRQFVDVAQAVRPFAKPVKIYGSGVEHVTPMFKQKFAFYEAVGSEGRSFPMQHYCLPAAFKVDQVKTAVATQAGQGTRLVSVSTDPQRPNCVVLNAFVQGAGVDRVGPIIVNHRGRGWLGAEIEVTGTQAQ